jgi:hypothetical protein
MQRLSVATIKSLAYILSRKGLQVCPLSATADKLCCIKTLEINEFEEKHVLLGVCKGTTKFGPGPWPMDLNCLLHSFLL